MSRPSLLLLAAPDDAGVRVLIKALSARWSVTVCVPRALSRHAGEEVALAELRRHARAASIVLYLAADGAAALAGVEGLVEVYAPVDLALSRLGPEERTDAEAWEALWRQERDLARRARLVAVPAEEIGLKARLLYGVEAGRLRQVAPDGLPAVLEEALAAAPPAQSEPPARFTLALNDYLVIDRQLGGAVRVRQGLAALEADTVLLSLGVFGAVTFVAPRVLQVSVPKAPGQRVMEADLRALAGQGLEDVVSALHAPAHGTLVAVAADLARRASVAVFEHCYLAPLLDVMHAAAPGLPVVYDAHNVEGQLKRELLAGHPAEEALCGFVEEVERRLVDAAALVLCCSDADAEAFRPRARQVVMMPHGVPPALPAATTEGAPRAGFLGSAHPPNIGAARFILEELAPRFPQVVFEIIGAVCASLSSGLPNVVLLGVMPEDAKNAALARWTVALNPVAGGSGASLKLADYLAHGLPTVNTVHAARGFAGVLAGAGLVVAPEAFPAALARVLEEPGLLEALRKAAREAAEGQSWPAVSQDARKAIEALAGAYRPPEGAILLAVGEDAARVGQLDPGYVRVDALPDGASPALPRGLDRMLDLPPLLAEPWDEAAGQERAILDTISEQTAEWPLPCVAYGVRHSGQALAPQFGLMLPAGTRRVALEWHAAAGTGLRLLAGGLQGEPRLVLDTVLEGETRLELPLPEQDTPVLLEGRVTFGAAGALQLRSASLLAPEPQVVDLALAPSSEKGLVAAGARPLPAAWRAWLSSHGGQYGRVLASEGLGLAGLPALAGPAPEAVTWAPLAALLAAAASARQAAAARQALGLGLPFTLVVGDAAWPEAEGQPVVRYQAGEASHRDADGAQCRVRMAIGGLLLSQAPPCLRLVVGDPAEAGLVELAALAGVPVSGLLTE
jgi:glycosyltransferase involved in cell wall biosynthesis